MADRDIKNARILEAFSLIDEKYIGEVASSLKLDDFSEEPPKASPWKSLRSLLALAACVMLLGAIFPITMKLINSWSGPAAGSETSEENTDHDIYIKPYFGLTLMHYNTASGEYSEVGKSIDIYTEYDGKAYYIRWESDEERVSKQVLTCYDPQTDTTVDLWELPTHRRSMLIASDGFLYFSTTQAAYRIPTEGGDAELLFDVNNNEAIYCVIGTKVIIVNCFANIIDTSTPRKSTITAFDLETRKKEVLWSAENTEYGMIRGISYYKNKVYISIDKAGFSGYVLTEFDLETRELYSVLEKPLSSYYLTPEGIYYHLYEQRTVNWRSSLSSLSSDYTTTLSPELYKCDLNGKNSKVVFKNSDFTLLSGTISDGKITGNFCGDFPTLGWKRASLILSIDISTGEIILIDKPRYDNYHSERIN